jgi:hypothetical protein
MNEGVPRFNKGGMAMSTAPVIVPGVVKPDGSLELQGKVSLPAGPVQVQVQAAPPAHEDWWQFLQRCRAELEASGASFRRGIDIAADMDQIRGEHDRIEAIYWEKEWQEHHPGEAPC